jgi:hypothetical protein
MDMLLRKHKYVIEPTGVDSPSQNGAVKIYNAKLGVYTQTLLFGSGLPASIGCQHWCTPCISTSD